MLKINIAIDGPAAAGKSTISKRVAERLGYTYIDTGAMYRAITFYVLENGREVLNNLEQLKITLTNEFNQRVLMNGKDVTLEIRSPEVTQNVSEISSFQSVREYLVAMQREIASDKGVVMDGRDIGTTVLPTSELKVFLNASPEVRAKRRLVEEEARGVDIDIETLTDQIRKRDLLDMSREISPLRQAKDAIFIDTSYMTLDEVEDKIITLAEEILKGDSHVL